MVLEVETPHPGTAGLKQKGRVYVCDLAGTEPAGDIVYALYERKVNTETDPLVNMETDPLGSTNK